MVFCEVFWLERKGRCARQLLIVHQSLLSTRCVKSAARSLRIPLGIAHRDVVGEFKVPLAPSVMGTVSKSQNSCILPEAAPGFPLQLFPALPQPSFDAVQNVQTTLLLCFFSHWERVFDVTWHGCVDLSQRKTDLHQQGSLAVFAQPWIRQVVTSVWSQQEATWSMSSFFDWPQSATTSFPPPTLPRYICTNQVLPSVLLFFPHHWLGILCGLGVFTLLGWGSSSLMWGWAF